MFEFIAPMVWDASNVRVLRLGTTPTDTAFAKLLSPTRDG